MLMLVVIIVFIIVVVVCKKKSGGQNIKNGNRYLNFCFISIISCR